MADISTSQLDPVTNLQATDLINVSFDDGGETYTLSKKIKAEDFDMVKGTRYFGVLAADPATITPVNGDQYYNSVLDMNMYYDAGRSKWLSVETHTIRFGRNGNTTTGSYYRGADGVAFSGTVGEIALENGTVIGIGYTRTDNDSATFEVTAGGTLITGAVLLSNLVTNGKTKILNSDFSEDDILGVRNQSGGNTTSNVNGWVRVKWRA
jgi:hypothetical protein